MQRLTAIGLFNSLNYVDFFRDRHICISVLCSVFFGEPLINISQKICTVQFRVCRVSVFRYLLMADVLFSGITSKAPCQRQHMREACSLLFDCGILSDIQKPL